MIPDEQKPFFDGTEDVLQWDNTTDNSPIQATNNNNMSDIYDFHDLSNEVFTNFDFTGDAEFTEGTVRDILRLTFETIAKRTAEKGRITLRPYFSFRLKEHEAETGTLPNGNTYDVGMRYSVECETLKGARDIVQTATGTPVIP
jgi:nucleoid DNA-binding protein